VARSLLFRSLLTAGLLLAACGAETTSPRPGGSGGVGGSGGADVECDRDGDGHLARTCGGEDCDDEDPTVRPGGAELCGNGRDDDCNGAIDDGCECTPGDWRACWPGAETQRHVGACSDGMQHCTHEGRWSACEGATLPAAAETTCDGRDEDCDGEVDEELRNACGGCGDIPAEVCGNGLDDDCDGTIDNPDVCRFTCAGVSVANPEPPWLACCVSDPATGQRVQYPVAHAAKCVDADGLPACGTEARPCLTLEQGAECTERCDDEGCLCGTSEGSRIVPSPACGYETPCAYLGCEDRKDWTCYSGPPHTLGVGICRAGRASCVGGSWDACEGEVVPAIEICGNGLDDDCDGVIDDRDGATGRRCMTGPTCATDAEEICGNGLDDDCDGAVDELCPAPLGSTQACYRGPASTRGLGACTDGVQHEQNGVWSVCIGDVLPSGEICGDGIDSDCNGLGGADSPEDPSCVLGPREICNGLDDDGDGAVDEGVLNPCGTCGSCERYLIIDPAQCALPGRSCNQVEPVAGDVEMITVGPDKRSEGSEEYLYHFRPSDEEGTVLLAQLAMRTREVRWTRQLRGAIHGPQNTGGPVNGLRVLPDTTLWVGTHPLPDPSDPTGGLILPETSWLYHLDREGNLLCQAPVPDGVAFIEQGLDGRIWVASFASGFQGYAHPRPDQPPRDRRLLAFSGTEILATQPDGSPWPDDAPRCKPIDLDPADPAEWGIDLGQTNELRFITIDRAGRMWLSGGLAGDFWAVLDTRTYALQTLDDPFQTGVTDFHWGPDDTLWISTRHLVNDVHEGELLEFDPAYSTSAPSRRWTVNPGFTDFLFEADGTLLGAGNGRLVIFDPATGNARTLAEVPADAPRLMPYFIYRALDGRIWVQFADCYGPYDWCNSLGVYDPSEDNWEIFPFVQGLYFVTPPAADPVGAPGRRNQYSGMARWAEVVDAVYPNVAWRRLDWEEDVPAGASVTAWLTFAGTPEGLDDGRGVVCGPFESPPADLTGCGGEGLRFARVEFVLQSGGVDARPVVRNIAIEWTRP